MTNTKHQPATPLPWDAAEYEGVIFSGPDRVAQAEAMRADAAYIAHAANAYPKLVEALRSTLGALEADAMRETDPQIRYYAEQHHTSVRALLRELGED